MTDRTYSTKANAKRALASVCKNCVKHAKAIIYETEEGRFALNEELIEQYMNTDEWQEVWGHNGAGLPIEPTVEEEVIVLTKPEMTDINAAAVLLGIGNVMNTQVCQKCGSEELYVGRCDKHGIVVDDDKIIGCHHCDWRVDTRKKTASNPTGIVREAQKTSMKLDRRISVVGSGEIYKNACAMWKANPTWMTSAQEDTLTKKLYAAAKKGEKIVVEINGRSFELVNV